MACPHTPGLWCPDCMGFVPVSWMAFAAGLLLGAMTSGCGTRLPPVAYPVPADELANVRAAWVAGGFPDCPGLALWVWPADTATMAALCPTPEPCLTAAGDRHVAVVYPHYPQGWRHEAWHLLERCAYGVRYDYAHAAPWWGEPREAAGIP